VSVVMKVFRSVHDVIGPDVLGLYRVPNEVLLHAEVSVI
jgi:hypothetical protein